MSEEVTPNHRENRSHPFHELINQSRWYQNWTEQQCLPETINPLDHNKAEKKVTTVDISHAANAKDIRRRLWTPFVLTPLGLSLILTAFFALSIATVALFLVSNHNTGIASVNSNYYYLWTYGPTAGEFIFVQKSYLTISQCSFSPQRYGARSNIEHCKSCHGYWCPVDMRLPLNQYY